MSDKKIELTKQFIKDFDGIYKGSDIKKLAKTMTRLQAKHVKLKEQAAQVWLEVDYIRFQAIPKMLESLNLDSCRVKGVGLVGLRPESSCKAVDPEGLQTWLENNGHGDIIKGTVNSSSLKALIKDLIKQGESIPGTEIIDFKPYEFAVITK